MNSSFPDEINEAQGLNVRPGALDVEVVELDNGLTVWLNEDHSQPKIMGAVVVKAGAKETPDTGIAHYFEHMMFKGTDKIGTINYTAEKAILDVIFGKYEALSMTDDPEERSRLLRIINELSAKAAEYVIPNEFDQMISSFGGTEMNAVTSYDYTFYFNSFAPQYLSHWAELNSERLLNPVFRMFQSEMETVYEERRRYNDTISHAAIEELTKRYFYPHPYAYPVIGSMKYLRNPNVVEMRKFFERYYVASNMGLILSGDFDKATALPIIRSTFSRLRKGRVPKAEVVELPDFNGKETVTIRMPLPFLRVMALGFRGASNRNSDLTALNVAVRMLNNSNGTGYLDRLTMEHKVKGAMVLNKNMNEAGMLGVLVLPKNWLQSYGAAEKLVWKQIDRLKSGDFTDEFFQSLKLELKRERESLLESIDSRAEVMMRVFSEGKSWQAYLDGVRQIDSLTREEVMEVVRKYFSSGNYLYAVKKTGANPTDKGNVPMLSPIVPKNQDRLSDYRKHLEELPVKERAIRLLDFKKDVRVTPLSDLVTLYTSPNPVNGIFSLTLAFGIGDLECRQAPLLAAYLPFLGTETMDFETFRRKLQTLGSTLGVTSSDSDFLITVHGFDRYFAENMTLLGEFLAHPKADEKKMKLLLDEEKVTVQSWPSSSESLGRILFEKIKFGNESHFLTKLSAKDIKKLKGEDLLVTLRRIMTVACGIHYCGQTKPEVVAEQVRRVIPIEQVTVPSNSPYVRTLEQYDKPSVFFVNKGNISQSIIYAYSNIGPLADVRARFVARLFNTYFGDDTASLLFQEIREFRSFAYQVDGGIIVPPFIHREKSAYFYMWLSTRSDKAIDSMRVFEELVRQLPLDERRLEQVKKHLRHSLSNDYPAYRALSLRVAGMIRDGFKEDPNKLFLEEMERITIEDIQAFYETYIRDSIRVYAVVANQKDLDLKQMEEFGEIMKLAGKNLYR